MQKNKIPIKRGISILEREEDVAILPSVAMKIIDLVILGMRLECGPLIEGVRLIDFAFVRMMFLVTGSVRSWR